MIENSKKILFEIEEGIVIAISNILKKYNLKESLKDSFKKIQNKKKPRATIIIEKIKELIFENISEENFILFLGKELNVDKEISKKIFKDIKENIITFAKIFDFKESLKSKGINNFKKLKPSVSLGFEKEK